MICVRYYSFSGRVEWKAQVLILPSFDDWTIFLILKCQQEYAEFEGNFSLVK